jgi:hypothetical protein
MHHKEGPHTQERLPGATTGTMQVVQEHTTFKNMSFASENKFTRWIRHHLTKHDIDSLMLQ